MAEIAFKLTDRELDQYRVLDTDMLALNSGSVDLELDHARRIINAHRMWWVRLYETYEHKLDEEEFYEVDTIRGIVFVSEE